MLLSLERQRRNEILRWLICGAVVFAMHALVALPLVMSSDTDSSDSAGAMVIYLAPMLAAPLTEPAELPPGPEQVQSEESVATPANQAEKKNEEQDETKPVEADNKIAEAAKAEVQLDSGAAKPIPEQASPQQNQIFSPVTTAVQLPRTDDTKVAVAPQQSPFSENQSENIPEWYRQVSTKLEKNKRYPVNARNRRVQGTVYVEFKLDRNGHIVESRIVKSSGSSELDNETLELLRRSDPLPRPPASKLRGDVVHLAIPMNFKIR